MSVPQADSVPLNYDVITFAGTVLEEQPLFCLDLFICLQNLPTHLEGKGLADFSEISQEGPA